MEHQITFSEEEVVEMLACLADYDALVEEPLLSKIKALTESKSNRVSAFAKHYIKEVLP